MPKHLEADSKLAFAAGTDAGNRSMRKAGRTAWSLRDQAVLPALRIDLFPASVPAAKASL